MSMRLLMYWPRQSLHELARNLREHFRRRVYFAQLDSEMCFMTSLDPCAHMHRNNGIAAATLL